MTTYLFQITDGQRVYADEEGMCLPTAAAALQEGRTAAWTLMCGLSDEVRDWSTWRVEVADETGRSLLTLSFVDVLNEGGHLQAPAAQVPGCD